MNIDYQKKLDLMLEDISKSKKVPKLLLHACCGPCSSYCIEYLSKYFDITIYYYNPNIEPKSEFDLRVKEVEKLIKEIPHTNKLDLVVEHYDPKEYHNAIKGLEHLQEGSERCFKCYELRMDEAAQYAKEHNYDYFTTTLSISPYKNALKLNEIGERLEKKYKIKYLYADFKKKNGYKRSIELSRQYNLYRQDYCGCGYSKAEAIERKKKKEIKSGVEFVMNSNKRSEFRVSKLDYKGFDVFKIVILIFIVGIILYTVVGKKVFSNKNEVLTEPSYKTLIEVNSDTLGNINEYYFYGDSFNLNGDLTIDNYDGFDVTSVNLDFVSDVEEIKYPLNYEVTTKGIKFYFSKLLNEGIVLDKDLKYGDYNILLVVTYNTSTGEEIVYYNLKNNTDYKETTYYTVTRDNKNNKLLFDTNNDLLHLNVEETTKSDAYYDFVIDPGHGGKDVGACYKSKSPCETKYTLDIAKAIKEKLESYGYKVKLTRTSDVYVGNYDTEGRVNIANSAKAKLLISIHLNSNGTYTYNGFELYASHNINYDFVKQLSANIKSIGGNKPSNCPTNRIAEGVYSRTFTNENVKSINSLAGKVYPNVSTSTNYYFIIRETGGYMAGAYTDGGEGDGVNYYRNSNTGLESYIYEMAYINNYNDIQVFENYKDQYVDAVANTINERFK